MRPHPQMYAIHASLFLRRMSAKYPQTRTLATVPDEEWQLLTRQGFDLVWLMGVWQRSPRARKEALLNKDLRREYDKTLPGWLVDDIDGSPSAVYAYHLHPRLGQPDDLPRLKANLNRQGLGLVLDFVPNHVARDNPWVLEHPGWFIQGNETDARRHPNLFFSPDGKTYFAHGRDPYFPPWTDTAQINYNSTELRQALINELMRIADTADGVRCDMAMLVLNEIFTQVWGRHIRYPQPAAEFWGEAITRVKERYPDFLFIAEEYWGLEPRLQALGFDFVYDKSLYDKLRASSASEIRGYLAVDRQGALRFIENHDEERAATAFVRERSLAAATVLATVPGLRMFHYGQLEGRRLRQPVQLIREPQETPDPEIVRFYDRLLTATNSPAFHHGLWELLDVSGPPGDDSHRGLLTWQWQYAKQRKIVAVNYSAAPALGFLRLPMPAIPSGNFTVQDELSGKSLALDAAKIAAQGLLVELQPWRAQILDMPRDSAS